MISNRTKISIKQFLDIMHLETRENLLNKHDNNIDLVQEIISTKHFLRNKNIATIAPATAFEERFSDLEKCLFLDGYKVETKVENKVEINTLIKIEPIIDGVIAFEDDLTNEIRQTNLSQKKVIIEKIEKSAKCFKSADYNGCLSNARIALETIARDEVCDTENSEKWGAALIKLKFDEVLNEKEEKMIAKTYTFISDGSHIPLGFAEEEYARYARNLCMSMCYFLVKKINGKAI